MWVFTFLFHFFQVLGRPRRWMSKCDVHFDAAWSWTNMLLFASLRCGGPVTINCDHCFYMGAYFWSCLTTLDVCEGEPWTSTSESPPPVCVERVWAVVSFKSTQPCDLTSQEGADDSFPTPRHKGEAASEGGKQHKFMKLWQCQAELASLEVWSLILTLWTPQDQCYTTEQPQHRSKSLSRALIHPKTSTSYLLFHYSPATFVELYSKTLKYCINLEQLKT